MQQDQTFQEFKVTARKWRPQHFNDVVGQEHITTTLQNAIANKRIHHAYLFSGPRGVGKTTTARILARAINCVNPNGSEPCNECVSCKPILESRSLDVIEIDGASNNSVDDIRKLRENAKYPPAAGKYKLYIIDEVHMLSTAAFNALLKTLEEPPPHLMFVFATTEPQKVPATILSRCQRFEFHRMEIEKISGQLKNIAEKENIEIDDESLITIAKKADGSMRDSQSIFDQVVAFCGKQIKYTEMADALHLIDTDFYFRISEAILEKNVNEMFTIAKEVIFKGYDFQECLSGLLEHFRNILTVTVTGSTSLIESSASYLEKFKAESKLFSKADLLRLINMTSATEQSLRFAPQPRIKFEMALVQMASLDSILEISELISELKELKKKSNLAVNTISSESVNEQVPEYVPKQEPKPKISASGDFSLKTDLFVSAKKPEIKAEVTSSLPDFQKVIETDELLNGWKAFLEKYATQDNNLQILKNSKLIRFDFFKNEVLIRSASELTTDQIEKKKHDLNLYINTFFGGIIKLRIMTDIAIGSETFEDNGISGGISIDLSDDFLDKEIEPPSSTSINNSHRDISGLHPVEKAVIEMFNAKEVKRI